MKCPTCKQTIRKPREKRQKGFSMAEYLAENNLQPITGPIIDPRYGTWRKVLVKPKMDKDGRAVGMAMVERIREKHFEWADMRYGHSPFDRPKDVIAKDSKLGTLEEYQKQAAKKESATNDEEQQLEKGDDDN